jgi:intracellular sulfur oxidation DsrE/DsrF family protein
MPDRRQFLGTLAVAGVATVAKTSILNASPSGPQPPAVPSQQKWDLRWLEDVKAKQHKQVFDMGVTDVNGVSPLHFPFFWLNAQHEVYGSTEAQLGAVIGIAGNAFPINFQDAIWAKYPLGEKWKVMDASTSAAAKRNVYADPAATGMAAQWTVTALQKRGVIFWMCNNALTIISGMMADASKQTHDAVYNEFKAGLLAGVKLVPSHTMMLTACQEHGCAYQRV